MAFSGHDLYDWGIRLWTRSIYTHVGLLLRFPVEGVDRVWLYQATPSQGVNLIPASRAMEVFEGRAWLVKLDGARATQLNGVYPHDLIEHAITNLGKPYDVAGILHFFLPLIRPNPNAFFCSKLTAEAFRYARLSDETFESPGKFLSQPLFTILTEL